VLKLKAPGSDHDLFQNTNKNKKTRKFTGREFPRLTLEPGTYGSLLKQPVTLTLNLWFAVAQYVCYYYK
jgi:hypothetical protein